MLAAISVMNQLYDKPNLTSVGKPPVDTILFSLALFFSFFHLWWEMFESYLDDMAINLSLGG